MADCPLPTPDFDVDSLLGKVLVMVRSSSPARIPIVERLWHLGVKIILIHPFHNKFFMHFVAHWIEADTDNVGIMEREVRKVMKEQFGRDNETPDGICTFDDYGVYTCAELNLRFNLRPQPFGPAEICETVDKRIFRKYCAEKNISSPQAVVIGRGEVASEKIKAFQTDKGEMSFPLVMKCTSGAGKLQTKLCSTFEELDEHAQVMWNFIDAMSRDLTKHLCAHGEELNIQVEEYIGGQEVDIDCIVENGKVVFCPIADNFATKPPFFSEMGGVVPSELPEEAQESLVELLNSWIRSYGDKVHGCLHFEAKYDPARPRKSYIVEVNCRLGGAETHCMISAAYPVDLGECVVRLALGMKPFRGGVLPPHNPKNMLPIPRNFCASVNILPPKGGGKLIEVWMPPEFHEPDLVRAQTMNMGAVVFGPPHDFGCVVWLVARGKTAEEAKANIARLAATVRMRMEHVEPPQQS